MNLSHVIGYTMGLHRAVCCGIKYPFGCVRGVFQDSCTVANTTCRKRRPCLWDHSPPRLACSTLSREVALCARSISCNFLFSPKDHGKAKVSSTNHDAMTRRSCSLAIAFQMIANRAKGSQDPSLKEQPPKKPRLS